MSGDAGRRIEGEIGRKKLERGRVFKIIDLLYGRTLGKIWLGRCSVLVKGGRRK